MAPGSVDPTIGETAGLDPAGRQVFDQMLATSVALIEYGGGGSTVQAAKSGKTVFSVESDKHFAAALKARVADFPVATVIHGNMGVTGRWGRPLNTLRTGRNQKRWSMYISAPWDAAFAAGVSPDLALVDGRFRVAATAYSWMRLAEREGGGQILVDDYVGRPHYDVLARTFDLSVVPDGRVAVIQVPHTSDVIAARDLLAAYGADYR